MQDQTNLNMMILTNKQTNNQKKKCQSKTTKPGETCIDTETNVFTHTAIPQNHKTGSLNIYTEHL